MSVLFLCQCSSQRSPSPGSNHVASSSNNAPNSVSAPPSASAARPSCSFTPTLAAHFNENLIKHVQGWPAEHAEKQVCVLTFIMIIFIICTFKSFFIKCTVFGKGVKTTWRGSHHGEHLYVRELHRAQKPAVFGQSLWNPSNITWAEVRIFTQDIFSLMFLCF